MPTHENKRWRAHAAKIVKRGNWMIRCDENGVSHGGFRWRAQGQWTEAPDWHERPECNGGLFGQSGQHGGYMKSGSRLLFCETEGKQIVVDDSKVKVRRARILLIDELPCGLNFKNSLNLDGCTLPEGFTLGDVGGWLSLSGCTLPGCKTAAEIRKAIRR